ncbi:MAG: GNAT family N-acetyltransferase [Pseudomonadota bacterium]
MKADLSLLEEGGGSVAAEILAGLTQWFARQEAVASYVALAQTHPTIIVRDGTAAIGFLTLKDHFGIQSEIAVMGVRATHHRAGFGTALVQRAIKEAAARGARYLTVKTLGAESADAGYAKTRAFYGAVGFLPFENLIGVWGADTPCLQMLRPL